MDPFRGKFLGAVAGLLLLEGILFVNAGWNQKPPSPAAQAFLVRTGNQYTLAWKDAVRPYQMRSYPLLRQALDFAYQELGLTEGRSVAMEHEIEHAWLGRRFGYHVLLWKTAHHRFLHQLTFTDVDEAYFFLSAFKRGAYAPSLLGHAIVFVPRRDVLN